MNAPSTNGVTALVLAAQDGYSLPLALFLFFFSLSLALSLSFYFLLSCTLSLSIYLFRLSFSLSLSLARSLFRSLSRPQCSEQEPASPSSRPVCFELTNSVGPRCVSTQS